MTLRLTPRSWKEMLHELDCPECHRRRVHRRLMMDRLEVVEPEPTQEQIDAWMMEMADDGGPE